ncbi:MAG: hypothetical protein ABJJ38_19125, partial [Roseibium sp.]
GNQRTGKLHSKGICRMGKAGREKRRHCVFCGKPASSKNREHILPKWLLKLTGDPRRVVTMAINPETAEPIKFSWSALVMPACEACNLQYSALEGTVKPIVQALLERKPITSREAFDLLDWLDKVRVCLWLNQITLQSTIETINPHLHVNSRIGKKDRLLYVYTIEGHGKGLNGFGIESLIFQHHPSCFALRVNDIILFNASSDYSFSSGCGFWHPEHIEKHVDGEWAGRVAFVGHAMTRKLAHPIVDYPLLKAALRIIQPIAQCGENGEFFGPLRQNESYHFTHMSDPSRGTGIIFQQREDSALPIYDFDVPLDFEGVNAVGNGCVGDIVAQVYRFQLYLFQKSGELIGSEAAVFYAKSMSKILSETNEMKAVLAEKGQQSQRGNDFVTQAFRDSMVAAKRPSGSKN